MISLNELAQAIGGECQGDGAFEIRRPAEPKYAQDDELALAGDPKYITEIALGSARAAILPHGTDWNALGLVGAIWVSSARRTMVEMSKALEVPWSRHWAETPIHPTSIIHPQAVIEDGVLIGPYTIIGPDVHIASGVVIHDHVSISHRVRIGKNSQIYSGVRIGPDVVMGDDVIIMTNSSIGADGFSYLTPNADAIEAARKTREQNLRSDDEIERINSLGGVQIGNRVELGANVCVDRGTLKDTIIGEGTKVDNLVQIAHNVHIGRNNLVCGQAGLAGTAKTGDRCIIGGGVSIADHVTLGDDVIATGRSAIASDVADTETVIGYPAIPMRQHLTNYKNTRRLPRLMERVKKLEAAIERLRRD